MVGAGGRRTMEDWPDGTGRSCGMASGAGLTTGRRGGVTVGAAGGATVEESGGASAGVTAAGAATVCAVSGAEGAVATREGRAAPVTGRRRGIGAGGAAGLGADTLRSGAAALGGGAAGGAFAAEPADFKRTLRTKSAI